MKMERMNVFVKVEEYNSILELMGVIRKKLDEVKETLSKIHELNCPG